MPAIRAGSSVFSAFSRRLGRVGLAAVLACAIPSAEAAAETRFACDGQQTDQIFFSFNNSNERLTGTMGAGDTIAFTVDPGDAQTMRIVAQTTQTLCDSPQDCAQGVSFTAPVAGTYTFDISVPGLPYRGVRYVTTNVQTTPGGPVSQISYPVTYFPSASVTAVCTPATVSPDPGGSSPGGSGDVTAPSVAIDGTPDGFTGTTALMATVTFSEAVTGFAAEDLAVTGGTVTALTGSGQSYAVTVVPTGTGDVTLQVPAGVATDAAGNGNTASAPVTVARRSLAEATGQVVGAVLEGRGRQLLGSQPDLAQLFTGGPGGGFTSNVTRNTLDFGLSTGMDHRVWAQLQGSFVTDGAATGGYAFGVIGGHLQPTANLLVGGMVQLDYFDAEAGAGRATGVGWMAGPYLVARLPNHPLVFDARLLYGQGRDEISPFGTYRDSTMSDRWLAQVGVTGRLDYTGFSLLPALRLAHATDTVRAYTDTPGTRIPTQGVALTEAGAGLGVEIPLPVARGALLWTAGAEAIWAQTAGTGASALTGTTSGRGRVDMGFDWRPVDWARVALTGFYDGIGLAGFSAVGAGLTFEAAF